MILDMHVHTAASDDAAATAEAYLRWIGNMRKKHQIHGMVFTEHRSYDQERDYSALAQKYDVLIFKGAEIETMWGHFLVYGVTDGLLKQFDFMDINLDAAELVREVQAQGGIAVPSHPGRKFIGLCDYINSGADFSAIKVIEALNGGSSQEENRRAFELAAQNNLFGIGGSDAHYVSALGTCMTQFKRPITCIEELVEELYSGDYKPIYLKETQHGGL
ncbi:MAG: hypothetical protein HY664_07235 [Chloroflexi bacterium]|nr:hypothetical protein [Chloroflexota bacterium]